MARSTPAELERRKAAFAEIPWVRRINDPGRPCQGVKWGHVALKDIFSIGEQPARGVQPRACCKRRAIFHYTLAKSSRPVLTVDGYAREGDFCWSHASSMLYYEEEPRYRRWLARKGE